MSEDPIGFRAGDFNLYRYVENQPLIAKDPSGKNKAIIGLLLCGAAVYGIVRYGVQGERKDQCSLKKDADEQTACKDAAALKGVDDNFQDMSDDASKAFTDEK